jgi:hypothetical protein
MTFKMLALAATAAGLMIAGGSSVQAAELVHGVHYGTGNDYIPGNWTVTTTSGVEDGLRAHVTGQPAPAPVGNTYTFGLGQNVSFDFSLDPTVGASPVVILNPLLTITNLAGGSAAISPYSLAGNAPTGTGGLGIQNSESLSFGFLNGGIFPFLDINYDAGVNSTYVVTLSGSTAGGAFTNSINIVQGTGFNAVPEPGTWALMIVGFGMAGAMVRRRKLIAA